MRIFGENENRDLYLGPNKQLVILTGIEATEQACKSAIEAQRGEMQFAVNRGVPTEQTLWNGSPNQQQYQFYCRQALGSVANVVRVISFDTEIIDGTLSYTAVILTTFGESAITDAV